MTLRITICMINLLYDLYPVDVSASRAPSLSTFTYPCSYREGGIDCLNAAREAAVISKSIGPMDMLCELGVLARGDVWSLPPAEVINASTSTNATNIEGTTVLLSNGKEGMVGYSMLSFGCLGALVWSLCLKYCQIIIGLP